MNGVFLHSLTLCLSGTLKSSLKNMRQFYEEWSITIIRQPLAGELPTIESQVPVANTLEVIDTTSLMRVNRQPSAGEMYMGEFLGLCFTHHMEILNKTKTLVKGCSISMRLL